MEGGILRRAAVFHAVGVAGGITAAGIRIGKSPPAVHADLRRFERDVGVALTERVGRSLRLTRQGQMVFDAIGRAISDIDRTCASVSDQGTAVAQMRLGSVTGFGRYRLAPVLLSRLPANQPLLLRTDSHDALLLALGRGEIDLALTYRPVIAAPFETIAVAEEDLVLVGSVGPDALASAREGRLRFITYSEHEYVFGRWFAEVLGRQPSLLRRHDHFGELEEALYSVAAGRGVTIAPADACTSFGLTPQGPSCRNSLYLCGTRSALDTPDARLLIDCLRAPVP